MPKMQTSEVKDGVSYAYTLPADTMRLALQEEKDELLKQVKQNAIDKSFSFAFFPLKWRERLSNRFGVYGFVKVFRNILSKRRVSENAIANGLTVDRNIFKKVCKGSFLPTKNLIFSIALVGEFSVEETDRLLDACGEEWQFTQIKDVVLRYILEKKAFSAELIETALAEYKVENLYIDLKKSENR